MKKMLVSLLLIVFSMALFACTNSDDNNDGDIAALTAVEVSRKMGHGINLGNTMEAYGRASVGIDADISAYETAWGSPVTTREMINGMKASGFDTLRIPVAWTNMMDFRNGDYTINEVYLARVAEIVNYGLDAGMFVIINEHWSGGWWGMFGSATPETREEAMALYVAIWTQVGLYFKDYSHYLIFESGNEEIGDRLNDTDVAEDSGWLTEDQTFEVANQINQRFVDVIRQQGGNNANRFLLIAGYHTDIDKTNDQRFEMPTDTAENKLMISVHYYTPWSFTGSDSGNRWGTQREYEIMNTQFEKMQSFAEQGYGVIVGEYAALPKNDGSLKDDTLLWTKHLLDNSNLYGYVPVLWDRGDFYSKVDYEIVDEDLAELFLSRSAEALSELTNEEIMQMAQTSIDTAVQVAIQRDINDGIYIDDGSSIAWIMYVSSDWALTHNTGDDYGSNGRVEGVSSVDVAITQAGIYTVSIDFSQTSAGHASGIEFMALGIFHGETNFPDYIVRINEIKVNGEVIDLRGISYTTADKGGEIEDTTRVNLYNAWVTTVPADVRLEQERLRPHATPVIVYPDDFETVVTIEVTFEYISPN